MTRHKRYTFGQWCSRYLMNLNLIVVVGVLVYILFFTDNSVQDTYSYEQEGDRLARQVQAERDTLELYRDLNRRIASDRYTLEQVARERYHMQRPHEDVYIVK